MRTLKRMKSSKTAVISGLILFTMIIFGFYILNSRLLFTYRSNAAEDSNNTHRVVQDSQAFETVTDLDRLNCVSDFSYVRENTDTSCFVQFSCDGFGASTVFGSNLYTCVSHEQSGQSCSYNADIESCPNIETWLQLVQQSCGCE